MGYDGKYGKVTTEHGNIPDDEPVIVFRARDVHTVQLIDYYKALCAGTVEGGAVQAGYPASPQRHLDLIEEARRRFADWQAEHADQVKAPDSERSREWMD